MYKRPEGPWPYIAHLSTEALRLQQQNTMHNSNNSKGTIYVEDNDHITFMQKNISFIPY